MSKKEIPVHDDKYWKKKSIKEVFYLVWQVFWGLPKTFLFNLYYLGFIGLKMPILCSYKVKLSKLSGKVEINNNLKFGMIKLGFTAPETYDNRRLSFVWINDGIVRFQGTAGIRNGVSIRNYGELILGDEFHISAPSTIICYKRICFGRDVLIGWNCEFVDGDAHKVYITNENISARTNIDEDIIVGDHVWFGANVKVYKGTRLGNNIIVAGSSVLLKSFKGDNLMIGGYPGKVLKQNVNWKV